MDITQKITKELGIKPWQAEAVINLIDEGNTIPFIARYRKEATGALDDEILRRFDERLKYLRSLEERKQTVISSIESQGKLTDELLAKLEQAETVVAVEDIYRPYKPKRRTRAMIAREKGLEGLATYIMSQDATVSVPEEALKYLNEEHEVNDADTAIKLAIDIIAGDISDDADIRTWIRTLTAKEGVLITSVVPAVKAELEASGERSVYENYFEFAEKVDGLPGHRILAINRGENEKVLSVKLEAPVDKIEGRLFKDLKSSANKVTQQYIEEAASDAYKRLIAPSIETEIRNELTLGAQEGAIKIFASNLEQLLMQPPIGGKTVLGWDPAFRTGCKLAVVDATGKIQDTTVIYPTAPQNKVKEAKLTLAKLVKKYDIDIISVGNGTASRESEQIIAEFIKEYEQGLYANPKKQLQYVIVNEAGASVYSASKLATEEYPDLDVGERSSASIARRLQDPLAELVKIDPRSIGVGQYQHDMDQKRLAEALGAVVEDCVNSVGVDLNTASASLLEYVSGISKPIAANIVKYREENGRFDSRKQLLKVAKLGPKAFEQCAGFLRIRDGKEPLDCTAVHPESYDAARKILEIMGYKPSDIITGRAKGISDSLSSKSKLQEKFGSKHATSKSGKPSMKQLAEAANIGEYTLKDILSEIEKPGRDPREEAEAPLLRSDVLEISDLRPDMELKGTVRNIVDFGAFVDIGVHQDGLVHISELSDRFVKHPLDVVKVGDIVNVRVLSVDEKRKKIALSMKKKR
jgi:tex-like protein